VTRAGYTGSSDGRRLAAHAPSGVTFGVMARAPAPGRCKTRLAASLGDEGAASLYRAMLLDTVDALGHEGGGDTRLVVMAAPENDGVAILRAMVPPPWEVVAQEGQGLGERLTAAVRALGGPAGDRVALVSSDSPTVDWRAVTCAVTGARGGGRHGRVQMGPCADGGYYLIALGAGDVGIFDGIAWSTPLVQAQTRARCAALALDLEELAPGLDVDEVQDLVRLRHELRADPRRAPRTAATLGLR